ncbi:hypothetical protein G7Y89_g5848 [Cudoniella acicularis]|uniref:Lysophospholipase NTE1 n=1 Tax=Cudoniella acicularis TaxID=354080 RepID=A0A8H4RPY9_9HELO|nr:hypothetical protein G7Y89_g5848 [Cudoniella acicularis]
MSSTSTASLALATAQEMAQSDVRLSWLGRFGRMTLFLIQVVPGILYWLITFTTITMPTFLFTLFSTSLTFTMNATTLALILVAFVSTISWFVRYRFLNMYARLPPEPQRKEPQIDLYPDTQEEGSKSGFSNYLDEFLSAIKVFGYLERPVFHELTRSMQTRKLIAGETLNLEDEKGFCLVVDGLVEIFVKSSREGRESDSELNDFRHDSSDSGDNHHLGNGHQGYQLLTEVKNGAPMSSLFSILSLFTEDVKLRHTEDDDLDSVSSSAGFRQQHFPMSNGFGLDHRHHDTPPSLPTSPIFGSASQHGEAKARDRRSSTMAGSAAGSTLPKVPPLSLDVDEDQQKPKSRPRRTQTQSAHPDIVARATVDTTIAIIPASAFRRLTRVYPKATAHIVQVILTRLQRVTLATGHSYLGLTSEVLRTEKHMNKYTTYELPNFLRGDALERLKEKFTRERERIGAEEGSKGIALHNAAAGRRRGSSNSLRKEATVHALSARVSPAANMTTFEQPSRDIGANPSPGDLLTNIQMSRSGGRRSINMSQGAIPGFAPGPEVWPHDSQSPLTQKTFNPFANTLNPRVTLHRQESVDEDSMFRGSILECIFKAIGLTNTKNALRMSDSVEASPRLVSYDQKRQKAVFTSNAFGFIDPYEAAGDGDTESITSGGISVGGYPSTQGLAHELKDEVEIVYFPKGSVLVEQGERNPGLYYVIDGFLDVSVPVDDKSESTVLGPSHRPSMSSKYVDETLSPLSRTKTASSRASGSGPHNSSDGKRRKSIGRKSLALIKPGGIAGYIGTISSYRSFIDVVAKTDVYVGFLPRSSLERIVEKYPVVLLTMAKRLTSLLPRLILHIDFALEWVQVSAGQVIYHQGDDSDAIYIVLNGRLRLVLNNEEAEMKVVGEYGQGESVGELEVMTESTRPATLHAIRDTELAKFPRTLFNSLAQEHPGITIKISKIIASRMRALIEDPIFDQGKEKVQGAKSNKVSSTLNLRTVAILPVTAGVPVVEFASRLMNALTQIGATNGVTSLNQAAILNHLGRHAFSRMGKLKLSQYLADLEEKYGLVLYVADTNVNSPWTQTCISQADCILLVGLAEGSPAIGEYERFLLGMKTTARKELVLLHADRFSPPGTTRAWLRNRVWINGGHHHVQMEFRSSVPVHPQTRRFGHALKQRVQVLQAEIQKYTSRRVRQTPLYSADTPFKGDFHRIARRLCGKSIGLVLGGGGARGIAQVGIIRALEEAGIPIDIVGGTSIGAFIGALYARDADVVPMYGRAKKFAGRMASMWRFALDLTYPSASYTTGHEFNRGIFKTFGNNQIEDFWLEFYCNTTNISKSRSEIHTSGYAWRYVRASMSLAGLLPPLCDEGSMLLDGGYVDNLTVTHMKSLGADVIFAIDVGSLDDDTPQTFGDSLSGFWAFANRWNPFSSYPNPPTLAEIQARLAYVSSVDALERAKNTPGCLYMRPPIDDYGTLEFGKFDEIYQVGYTFGQSFLAQMRDQGVLPLVDETEEKKALRRTMAPRRANVTFMDYPMVFQGGTLGSEDQIRISTLEAEIVALKAKRDEDRKEKDRLRTENAGLKKELEEIQAKAKADRMTIIFHSLQSKIALTYLQPIQFIPAVLYVESPFKGLRRFDEKGVIVAIESVTGLDEKKVVESLFPRLGWSASDVLIRVAKEGQFFFPGFIDTHIHASQYPNAGIFGKTTLLDWLNTYTFPMESSLASQSKAKTVYTRCIERTLSHGTTTAAYYATISVPSTNLLAELCLSHGQRAFIGRCCMDSLSPDYYRDESAASSIADTKATIEHIKKIDPQNALVTAIITPRFAPSCTSELMHGLGALHKETNLPIQTHISENKNEIELVNKLFPGHEHYTGVYDDHGLLTSKTILAHGVHLSEAEVDLIVKKEAKISHCPASNSAITSGTAKVRWLLQKGVEIGLGTDVSGGYSASILEAVRQAALVSRHVAMAGDEEAKLSIEEVLYLGTQGGAKVVGLEDKVGSFVVGKEWDAQLIGLGSVDTSVIGDGEGNVDIFGWETWDDRVAKWVYNGDDRNTLAVWVKGRLVHERKL